MKRILSVWLVLATLSMAACASTGSEQTVEPALLQATVPASAVPTEAIPTSTAPAVAEPTLPGAGESLEDVLSQPTETGGKGGSDPQPEVRWDEDPEKLIISVTHCCGLVPELVQMNYIPEAQVWGDGRIIWTHFDGSNQRQVLAGRLTPEQLAEFLQKIVDSGFFDWEELYTSPLAPTDLPTRCIFIELADQSRKVCEYFEGAPEAFHQFYDELDQGLGLEGEDYTPGRGYLTAFGIEGPEAGQAPTWNNEAAGLAVKEAASGVWVEGPALEAAWALVNQHPSGPTVQEGETFYRLALQIPQVSMVAPPQP